ncbi:tetratricopeptide repeat protein [Allohahella marinimesophila]|uniref:Tetratricopeptide repeat protein n=1 Tax=Allohahella marinimesophila TaxID=1054972 RepID=A0ABP7PEZ4_9GAMM
MMRKLGVFLTTACLLAPLSPVVVAETRSAFVVIDKVDDNKTIGELKPAYVDFAFREAPRVSIDEVIDRYIQLINRADDPRIQALALLRMESLEDRYGSLRPDGFFTDALWDTAIEVYRKVIALPPATESQREPFSRDLLQYQLAKALDMRGRQQESLTALQTLLERFPSSGFATEAQFRIAEAQYTRGEYELAEENYREVSRSNNAALIPKAQYMLAWSMYKNDRNQAAIDQFLNVLVDIQSNAYPDESNNQAVEDDVARIISVIATQNGGESFLNASMARQGNTDLAAVLYKGLYTYQLGQERFQDAANVAEGYIQRFARTPERPSFHELKLQAFEAGKLPQLVWQERERYVDELGQYSDYWKQLTPEEQNALRPRLFGFREELGRRAYSLAQADAKAGAITNSQAHFDSAAEHFTAMLQLSPEDQRNAEISFLLGDTWLQLGALAKAVEAYDQAGYAYEPTPAAADAAYAGITTRTRMIEQLPTDDSEDRNSLVEARISAAIRFGDTYAQDDRSGKVVLLAANDLYQAKRYDAALVQAKRVIELTQNATHQLDAHEIAGSSAFELGEFAQAERSFDAAIILVDDRQNELNAAERTRRADLMTSYVASIYKQGEAWEEKGDMNGALQEYLRVVAVAPTSPLAESARYDAAMRALDIKDWELAIDLMKVYRKKHPSTELAKGIPAKLAFAFDALDQPGQAGDALAESLEQQPADERRQTLLQVAGFYREAGRSSDLVKTLQAYARDYPQPFDAAVDVRYELYTLASAPASPASVRKQVATLRDDLISFERSGGSSRTGQSRALAAEAAWARTEASRDQFEAIALSLPLNASLEKKTAALRALVADIEQSQSYAIARYTTAANHTLGDAYLTLSRDILESERPEGLNPLEGEQYTILLEDQAYPFEEKAIGILEGNVSVMQQGIYDVYVQQSIDSLSQLLPVRYNKKETLIDVAPSIR